MNAHVPAARDTPSGHFARVALDVPLAHLGVSMFDYSVPPELLATAINSGLSACLIVAALAVGLAVPGLVFYRQRPLI